MDGARPCPECGVLLEAGRECAACRETASLAPGATVAIPVLRPAASVLGAPVAAAENLARIPLPAGMEVALDVTEGPLRGGSFRVEFSRVTIGRGGVEVAIPDARISRRHASLEVYGAACVLLKDLGSTNGTFVNGRRVSSAELQDGDEVRLGGTALVVSITAAAGAP